MEGAQPFMQLYAEFTEFKDVQVWRLDFSDELVLEERRKTSKIPS